MWRKSLLMVLFSLSVQGKKEPGKQQKPEQCFASLLLNATKEVRKGHRVDLSCVSTLRSPQNTSLKIEYSLFRNTTLLKALTTAENTTMFTISISTASELGSYKCKAQISSLNCTKYSNLLNFTFVGDATCPLCLKLLLPAVLLALLAVILTLAFWILRKHKARKAMKENALRVRGDKPEENVIYTTVKKKQAEAGSGPGSGPRPCVAAAEEETGHAQEIHYASPLFLDEASGGHDGDPRETDHVYCKLIL